jgi:uncharacterized membrane protein YbhN (UPF0104 family)
VSKFKSFGVFSVAMLLFIAVVVYTFREVNVLQLISEVSIANLLEVIFLGLIFRSTFGVIMWVGFCLQYNLKMRLSEIIFLPMMMHLFTYIIPFKGGILFQVFYSKHKYGLDLSKGFSLGVMIFLITVVLAAVLGLILLYTLPVYSPELEAGLWFMGLSVIGLMFLLKFIPTTQVKNEWVLSKLRGFLINVRIQLVGQLRNPKLSIALLVTTIISTLVQTLWFWEIGEMLGTTSEFAPILLIVLVLRVILLFRFVPGNLGLQEIMIAAVFAAAGFEIEEGLLVGLVNRLIAVFWTAALGLPALYSNLKYFDSFSIRGLINKVAQPNT